MSIKIKLTRLTLTIISSTLQGLYNSKATNRRERTVLSIGIQVAAKLERKVLALKSANLFDSKKKMTVSLLFFEADILEAILLQEIAKAEDPFIRVIIQKVIDELNQKLT